MSVKKLVQLAFSLLIFLSSANPSSAQQQNKGAINYIHYRPAGTKAGDVIPFYHDGNYHIFYLRDNNWSHLVSKDLKQWNELPDALIKSKDPLAADGEACWTGSIVEYNKQFYLFYTGKNMQDPLGDQKVMMATSKDLITWTKQNHTFYADGKIYWSKPVNGNIDDKQIYHHQAFRDPEVFRNPATNEWWMILHAMLADGSSPVMGRYISKDLEHWTPAEPLVIYPRSVSGDCPGFFSSNNKSFIYCADYHYMHSDNVGGPYDPQVKPYDCGDLRVPKLMWDGKRYILMGWICDYEGSNDAGQTTWGGTLSMPRELYTDSAGHVFQRPPKEIVHAFKTITSSKGEVKNKILLTTPADMMFHAKLRATNEATAVRIGFREGKDTVQAGYHLTINFTTKEIEAGSAFKSYKRTCDFDNKQPLDIRIFALGDVIECFVNDAYCFTMHGYDSSGHGLSIKALSGNIAIQGYDIGVAGK
ncbi:MAG: hypothetical protein QM802_15055 [Agriterribacter sp.]